jgi:hypothetical protein
MSQVCSKCSHANPPDAIYCYFDGVILGGHSVNGGPVQVGSHPFPSQFVFPTGQACRNFDQLAVACQQNWASAVDLLKQGFLASFLGGIGRADLALAAQEAARFPDTDRGLDQLLAKLPSHVLDAPKLRAEPTHVNLGVLPLGTNRSFELHLANQGMRLLYGSVVSDSKWLTLGDAPGNPQKLFQFGGEAVIPVQVRGQHLRAGNKSLEGRLVVESNGGTVTIAIRADVPPKPYPDGVLGGATTPRQIAEKAHAAPKEAAALFESGAVAKWFSDNGWIYPVQGPSASGVGAVQQFFEALGLSKAPKVEISQTALHLRGNVGQSAQAALELKAQEKRPVYAHAVCDQPWLDVSKTVLSGRMAMVQVVVPHVPDRPGETLQATVTVTANGNQKFAVPVTLEIGGTAPYYAEVIPVATAVPIPMQANQVPPPLPFVPVMGLDAQNAAARLPMAAIVAEPGPALPGLPAALPVFAAPAAAQAIAAPPAPSPPEARPFVPVPVALKALAGPTLAPVMIRVAIHAVPAMLLAFLLLVILGHDIFFGHAAGDDHIPADPNPLIAVYFDDAGKDEENKDNFHSMRFGLVALPKGNEPAKKLTYSRHGHTNSTVVRIGGQTRLFGFSNKGESMWVTEADKLPLPKDMDKKWAEKLPAAGGMRSVWTYQDRPKNPVIQVKITQMVEVVPGEPIEDKKGKFKRYFDTCRVRYFIENTGREATQIGLRVLIDTLIGVDASNDGVPFTVPGLPGLVDKSANFEAPKAIPDFIQVLENPDLKNPGIVGFMNLKLGGGVEPPSRLLLTHWTERIDLWDVPERSIISTDPPDSAVVLYWPEKLMRAGEKREVGFSYGLGSLSIAGGKLGISVGGSFVTGGDLTVVGLVNNPEKGQTLTLKLPPGLRIVEGELKQPVPSVVPGAAAQQSPVTWRIRAEHEGTFLLEVQSSNGVSQKKSITIKAKTIF